MTSLRLLPRVLRIAAVVVRYRLDDVIDEGRRFRILRWARLVVPRARAEIAALPRGERLVIALTELGPIFVNFLLTDEINRAPAKVQSALLEIMAEQQVTIGGVTHPVPNPDRSS